MSDLDRFSGWLAHERFRPSTARNYRSAVETLLRDGTRGLKPTTLAYYASGWEAWRKWRASSGLDVPDPIAKPEKPANRRAGKRQRRHAHHVWTEPQWAALLARARAGQDPVDTAIAVVISTGMRCGDVLRLRRTGLERYLAIGRLDFEAKGAVERTLVADEGQADDLRALASAVIAARRGNVAAFVTEGRSDSDMPADPPYATMRRRLLAYGRALGVPGLQLHDARHTIALRVYERSGHDARAVQALLGHSDIATTYRYLATLVPDQEAARAVGVPRRGAP